MCQYKNGALLFSTAESFDEKKANEILEIFKQQKLISVCQPKGLNLFRVTGRMNLHYDPFANNKLTWEEVLGTMTSTIEELDSKLTPYYIQKPNVINGTFPGI